MAETKALDALVRRQAQQVNGLTEEAASEFARNLDAARQVIRGRIAEEGDALSVFRLQAVSRDIESTIVALAQRGTDILGGHSLDAEQLALDHLKTSLGTLGNELGSPIPSSFAAGQAMSDPVSQMLAAQHQTSMLRYGADLLGKVRGSLIQGAIVGDSAKDVAARITGERGAMGIVARGEADRLVRTEVSNAYGIANQKAMNRAKEKIPDLKKTWIHVGSYDCPLCSQLHGTTREMDGTWTFRSGRKTYTVNGPPAHPHCSCKTIPTRESWRKKLDELGYLDKSRRVDVAA